MDGFMSSSSNDDLLMQNQRNRYRGGSGEDYRRRRHTIREANKVKTVSSSTPCAEGRYWQDILSDYLKVQRKKSAKLSSIHIDDETRNTESGSPVMQPAAEPVKMVTAEEEAVKQAAMQAQESNKSNMKPQTNVDGKPTAATKQPPGAAVTYSQSSSTTELLKKFKYDATKYPFDPRLKPMHGMSADNVNKKGEDKTKQATTAPKKTQEVQENALMPVQHSHSFYRFSDTNVNTECQAPAKTEKLFHSSRASSQAVRISEDERQDANSLEKLQCMGSYEQRQGDRRRVSFEPPNRARRACSNVSSRSTSSVIPRKVSRKFIEKTAGDRWKVFVESRGTSTGNLARPRYQSIHKQKQLQEQQQQQLRRRFSRANINRRPSKATTTTFAEEVRMGRKPKSPCRNTGVGLEDDGIAEHIIGDDIRTSRRPLMEQERQNSCENKIDPRKQSQERAEKQQVCQKSLTEANNEQIRRDHQMAARAQRINSAVQTREDESGRSDTTTTTTDKSAQQQQSEIPQTRRSNPMENRPYGEQRRNSQGYAPVQQADPSGRRKQSTFEEQRRNSQGYAPAQQADPSGRRRQSTYEEQRRTSQGYAPAQKEDPPTRRKQSTEMRTIYRRNDSNARGYYNFLNLYRQRNPLLSYHASKKMASEIYRQLDATTKKYYYCMRTYTRRIESVDPVLETLAAAKVEYDVAAANSFSSRGGDNLQYPGVNSGDADVNRDEREETMEDREYFELLKRCRSVGYMNYLSEYRKRNRDLPFNKAIKTSAAIYLYLSKTAKRRYRALNRRRQNLMPQYEPATVEEVPISVTVRYSDSGNIEINATSDIINDFPRLYGRYDDDDCYDGCDSSDSSSDDICDEDEDEKDENCSDEEGNDENDDDEENCNEDDDKEDNRADDEKADDDESNEDQDSSSCSDAACNLLNSEESSFIKSIGIMSDRSHFGSNSYDADNSNGSSCRENEESESDVGTEYGNENIIASKTSQQTCNSCSYDSAPTGSSSLDFLQEVENEELEATSEDNDDTEKEDNNQDYYYDNGDSEYDDFCELEDTEEADADNDGDDDQDDDNQDDDYQDNNQDDDYQDNNQDDDYQDNDYQDDDYQDNNQDDDQDDDYQDNDQDDDYQDDNQDDDYQDNNADQDDQHGALEVETHPVNTADRIAAAAAAFAENLSSRRNNIKSNQQQHSETSSQFRTQNRQCTNCNNQLKEMPTTVGTHQRCIRVGQCPICEKIFCYRK